MDETDDWGAAQHAVHVDASGQAPVALRANGRGPGRPFAKGASGNPHGRPPGARNKATMLAQAMLQERAAEIVERAITLAREGDAAALKLCLERILPRQRNAVITLDLPPVESAADCTAAIAAVIAATVAGELTPAEAQKILALIDGQRLSLIATEFEQRVTSLEARIAAGQGAARAGLR